MSTHMPQLLLLSCPHPLAKARLSPACDGGFEVGSGRLRQDLLVDQHQVDKLRVPVTSSNDGSERRQRAAAASDVRQWVAASSVLPAASSDRIAFGHRTDGADEWIAQLLYSNISNA